MNRKLYRYVSFEDFINLVINNKARFVRPSSWKDEYEGYLFSHMETPEDVRHIVSEMYYNFCKENYYAIPNNYFSIWHSKWFAYVQCWSKYPETDAMWRCYSYGDRSIRLRTRDDKLIAYAKKIFPEEEGFSVYLNKVNYDMNQKFIIKQQINQMKGSLLAHEPYFHKRPAFRHEGEYRLLIADNGWFSAEGLSSFGVQYKIEEQIKGKSAEEIINYLTDKIYTHRADWDRTEDSNIRIEDAGDISEFLEGVMVHPAAPKWYVNVVQDVIENVCKERKIKIKFDGQSELYKLK